MQQDVQTKVLHLYSNPFPQFSHSHSLSLPPFFIRVSLFVPFFLLHLSIACPSFSSSRLLYLYCLICFPYVSLPVSLLRLCGISVALCAFLSPPSPALSLLPRLPDREGSRVPVSVCVSVCVCL